MSMQNAAKIIYCHFSLDHPPFPFYNSKYVLIIMLNNSSGKNMLKHNWLWFILFAILTGCAPSSPLPAPQALVVNEYLLVGGPNISTEQLVFHFANGDQKEILARTETYRDYSKQIAEYNNKVLKRFDYRQEDYQRDDNGYGYLFWHSNIYHGGEKIISGALFVKPVSVNASNTDFITEVETFDGTYLLTSDSYEERPWPPGREPYAYVGDQLLFIESTSTAHQQGLISVYLDDKLAYQTEMHPVSTYGTLDGPWSYNGHWAFVLLDAKLDDNQENWKMINRVVQDGQDLNTIKGYEQSFQFAVLNERPFFFYQKNGKIGISFDGQEMAANYDEIPHYNCCSPALLNPRVSMNMVWFFAKRGDDWYYVEAYVPDDVVK